MIDMKTEKDFKHYIYCVVYLARRKFGLKKVYGCDHPDIKFNEKLVINAAIRHSNGQQLKGVEK